MAMPPEDRTTAPRPGTVRDESARADDSTLRGDARPEVRKTEMKAHRGGPALWIVLAVVAALLLGFYLFSGAFATAPGPDTGVQVAPADAVGGAVTTTDPGATVIPEGSTADGTAGVVPAD